MVGIKNGELTSKKIKQLIVFIRLYMLCASFSLINCVRIVMVVIHIDITSFISSTSKEMRILPTRNLHAVLMASMHFLFYVYNLSRVAIDKNVIRN